jgi:hypothetical protein
MRGGTDWIGSRRAGRQRYTHFNSDIWWNWNCAPLWHGWDHYYRRWLWGVRLGDRHALRTPGSICTRVTKPGKVTELDRQYMMALLQSDTEIDDILVRASILHRVELVATGIDDVVLIVSTQSDQTFWINEFLMRNGHLYFCIDHERDHDIWNLIDSFHFIVGEIPWWSVKVRLYFEMRVTLKSQTALASINLLIWSKYMIWYYRCRSFGISCGSIWRFKRARRPSAVNKYTWRPSRINL